MENTPQPAPYQALPPPNLDETRRQLAIIDPRPDARFGFRTADSRGNDPRCAVMAYGTLDQGVRQSSNLAKNGTSCRPKRLLQHMQERFGAAAYVVVNELDGVAQKGANIIRVRALFADADNAKQRRSVLQFAKKVPPALIVASGGLDGRVEKLQLYWPVDGCPVDEFTAAQKLLVSRTGTDPAPIDRNRVMRLVGYHHLKREPKMSRIIAAYLTIRYSFSDLIARIRTQPQVCDP